MSAPIALKYIRTTKGCVVFPCLAAPVDQVAAAIKWPKLSDGIVVWDFNDLPLCLHPGTHGVVINDTNALRSDWGLPAYDVDPVSNPPSVEAVREFCHRLPKLATDKPGVL